MNTRYLRLTVCGSLLALLLFSAAVFSATASVNCASSDEGGAGPRAANYILSIVSGNATKKVDPSSPAKSATYGFQVKNTGDTSLPYCDLQLYPWSFPPEKWSYNFIPSCPFEVNPGETKTILLVIYPAADAEAKRYTFSLKGKTGVGSNSISINLDIMQYGDVGVKAPASQGGNPGETLEFIFEIINKGNGKDKFFIQSIETGVPGMVPYLKDNNNWTTEISTGKSAFKYVVLTIPYDQRTTEGSAGLQLSVTAQSNFNKTQVDVNWTLIQVYHSYDVSLGVSPPNATLLPGELAEFTVTVLNLGNGWDNITLKMSFSFNANTWTVNLAKNWFNLTAGRSNQTKLKITPPLDALKGSNYKIDLVAYSIGPPYPEMPVERVETLSIAVRQVKGLYVPVVNFTAAAPVAPGEVLSFGFNFTNKGNGEDTVNIVTIDKPVGWLVALDFFQNIRMQPFATQPIRLTVQAAINRNESMYGKYNVRLQIINSDKSSVWNLTFDISVKPVYEWEFTVEDPQGQVNPYARDSTSFSLTVTNTGNVLDDIQLTIGGGYASWGILDTQAVSLSYGEKKIVRLEVKVPTTAEIGRKYDLKVTAVSQNKPDLSKELEVSVAIVHLDLAVVPPGSLEVNGQVWKDYKTTLRNRLNFTVTIRNDGTDTVRGVNVKFYDGDTVFAEKNTSTIAPLKTTRFTVQWDADVIGMHIIRVKLDANAQIGEVHEDNNEGIVNVKVETKVVTNGPGTTSGGYLYYLVVVVALVAAVGVAYVIYQRRPKVDKELYESIYGGKNEMTEDERVTAERTEIEQRAQQKGAEGATTPGSYDPTQGQTLGGYQPPAESTQPAFQNSERIDLGSYQSASEIEQQANQPQTYEQAPAEPTYPEDARAYQPQIYEQAPEPVYETPAVPPTYELPQPKEEESYEPPAQVTAPAAPPEAPAPSSKPPVVLAPPPKKKPMVIKPVEKKE